MSLEQKITNLPNGPGIYMFKNNRGAVLYVGKAKSLRSRARSYFRPSADLDPAKQQMIKSVSNIATITTDTENEALILEANLIRQHQPPYNVVLTDDKYYLFIKITNEELPRVFPVRRALNDKARYFGPYSSARSVRQTLKLLRRIFPHKVEKESPREKIFPHPLFTPGKKGSYQLSTHPAGRGSPREAATNYSLNIANIIRFLQGRRGDIVTTLKNGMREAAAQHQYERAAIFRDQLQAIERLEGNQKVWLPRPESFDVVSIATDQTKSAANIFSIRGGKLLNKNTFLLKHHLNTSLHDITRQFLLQYYSAAQDIPQRIVIPLPLSDQATLATWINPQSPPGFIAPQRGHKKQLLAMGKLNAQQLLTVELAEFAKDKRSLKAAQALALGLGLGDSKLHRIETYDISHIQGSSTTGSMAVFIDGQPAPQHYRKFRISGQDKPNDYASLQQVLRRRFADRHQDWPIPDLVLIDGGKGQLSAAQKIMDKIKPTIPIAALAKQQEELFVPSQQESIRLAYDDDALYLIQRMRDEAHRFTLSYHQLLRSKRSSRSLLDEIPSIGPKTKKKILNHFGSLKAIRLATDKELIKTIGKAKTKAVRDYL